MTIFVSIASYRDPELIPTVQDCIAKARYPQDLHIGICWQHGPEETIYPTAHDRRIDVIDVDWHDSKGVCWARAEIMNLWNGEEYYLQIDSHHRFVPDWDRKLIEQARLTDSPKPIMTTYCQSYDPSTGQPLSTLPTKMDFDYFTADGIPMYRAVSVANDCQSRRPARSRFVSAHFLFTTGSFVREVEYDPRLYFYGEEITLAIRSYTCGYDLFHPAEAILFHQYSRDGRAKHWSDHSDEAAVEKPWHDRDRLSRDLVVKFLKNPSIGPFGCGPSRTLAQYEAYAGINFDQRMLQDYTLLGKEPPNPSDAQWQRVANRLVTIELERAHLSTALVNAKFWRVTAHDLAGAELCHIDLQREVLNDIFEDKSPLILIQFPVESNRPPKSWKVRSFIDESSPTSQISGEFHYEAKDEGPT